LVGITIGLSLIGNCFDASLWGFRRFDLLNAVDIPVTIVRTMGSIVVAAAGFGVTGLAVVTLFTACAGFGAKAYLTWRVAPYLRIRSAHLQRTRMRELVDYGWSNGARTIGVILRRAATPLLIGHVLGAASVTVFSLAARLISYVTLIMNASAGVLTPIATAHHSRCDEGALRKLLLHGGDLCTTAAGFLTLLVVLLGMPFISLWVGPTLITAGLLAAVLALGEFLPLSQLVAEGVLLGKARHRLLAALTVADGVIALALAALVGRYWGLLGMCIAFAVCGSILRGLPLILYSKRILQVRLRDYVRSLVLRPATRLLAPAAALAAFRLTQQMDNWLMLGLAGALASAALVVPLYQHPMLRARVASYT
jgi:O-antigen/teichoic acid export membrane protein